MDNRTQEQIENDVRIFKEKAKQLGYPDNCCHGIRTPNGVLCDNCTCSKVNMDIPYILVKNIFFKNDEIYNKAKIGFYIRGYFYSDKVIVEIDDLSKSVWQLPLIGIKDYGNPKIKEYTLEEFNKYFYIP